MEDTICVILAGGQSSRMGRDKALLPIAEGTFLSRLIEIYRDRFSVFVSVGEADRFPHPGAGEITDLRPGMGPLAGLEAAFLKTDADLVFLTATDLPFGTVKLAELLLERIGDRDACLIRRRDGGLEPAFAVYRRSCLPAVQSCLDTGRRSVRGLLEHLSVRYVEEDALPGFDLDRMLMNINTPENYAKALEMLLDYNS
ncbi:MAG: molybdenum cofactor guanylyltransferase [Oscillospiraceae bacterium]|nr:molybdenum cofactor guanylyltransferase [Oscillospiraceae bacterium]